MHKILDVIDNYSDSLVIFLTKRTWLLYIVAIVLCCILFLPGLYDIQPIDRDETRFAQATKQMFETQNFIDIKLGDEVRYKKPVGIYWLQAVSVSIFGAGEYLNQIGSYRIPSFLGGLIMVLTTIAIARRLFGREAATIAGLIAPLPLLVSIEAHLAKTDSMLVAMTALSIYVLSCLWFFKASNTDYKFNERYFLIFWLSIAFGILIKGINLVVIIPMILTLSFIKKDFKWLAPLKPHWGILLVLVFILPWFYLIQKHSSGDFLAQSVGNDLINKVHSGVESHGAPPFTHLLTHFGLLWPLSLLSPFAMIVIFKNRKLNDNYLFILASIIPAWIVFELTPTKLPHYTYPLYPLIIVGISGVLMEFIRDNYDVVRGKIFYFFAAIYILISLVISLIIPFSLIYFMGIYDIATVLLSILAIICTIFVLFSLRNGFFHAVILFLLLQTLLILPNMYNRVLPELKIFDISTQLEKAIDQSNCSRNAIYISGFREPSALFKLGTNIKFMSTDEMIYFFPKATPCTLFLVGEKQIQFSNAFKEHKPFSEVYGIKINGGDKINIIIYKR